MKNPLRKIKKKTNHKIWHKFRDFMEKNFREDWEKGTIHGYEAIESIDRS